VVDFVIAGSFVLIRPKLLVLLGDLRLTWEEAREAGHADLKDIERLYMFQCAYAICALGEYVATRLFGLHLCEEFKAGVALCREKPEHDTLYPSHEYYTIGWIQGFLCVAAAVFPDHNRRVYSQFFW
jgi:hypothetical protein